MVATRKQRQQQKPTATARSYRDRIVDLRRVPASDLVPHPLNPRVHPEAQNSALRASLSERGIADTLLTYVRADGRLGLIDGHERTELLGDALVPVVVTDLTEDEATAFLAEHDAITLLALYDEARSEQLAAALDGRHAESASLLRLVAETNPAASLLEALMLREEDRAGYRLSDGDESEEDDDADADTDEWTFGDDGALSAEEQAALDRERAGAAEPLFANERIVDAAVTHYRATGFPYRQLPLYISMQRLNRLARAPLSSLVRTSLCGDVADTYHPHRFHASAVGMKSPYEAFQEDALLRRAIELRLDGVGAVEQGYLPAMSVVTGTQACYNFRPGFAAYVYRTRCASIPGAITLDTSAGYGGRLLGYLASGVWRAPEDGSQPAGRYIGVDPSTQSHAGNTRMAAELGFAERVTLINLPAEDVDVDAPQEGLPNGLRGVCDIAFTSPPYFGRERYCDEETQSWKRYPTAEAWRAGFLQPMLRLQYDALKPGAQALLNIDDVRAGGVTIPLVDWAVEDAQAIGFTYEETARFETASEAMGVGHDPANAPGEPVLVFRKPQMDAEEEVDDGARSDARVARSQRGAGVAVMPSAMTLAGWMARLYRATADERKLTTDAWLGVWPEELREYIEQVCLMYATGRVRFAVAPGLIVNQSASKPRRSQTCALLFSGGKDSIAAGMLAERAYGYRPHALFLRKVNHAYPQEAPNAERIARVMGWDFTYITPQRLPKAYGDGLVKNQYIAAVTLEMLPYIPGAFAFGNYEYHDVNSVIWYGDMMCAFNAFDRALSAAWDDLGDHRGGAGGDTESATTLQRLSVLRDDVEAYRVWRDAPQEARELTTSCTLPEYNKVAHRRRSLAKGLPLTGYECGVCEKCRDKALIFAAHFPDDAISQQYPTWYLEECRKRIAKVVSEDVNWTHTHPRLITWDVEAAAREGRQPQNSMSHYIGHVLSGLGRSGAKIRARTLPPAYEPIVSRLDHEGYLEPGEPALLITAANAFTDVDSDDEASYDDPKMLNGDDDDM